MPPVQHLGRSRGRLSRHGRGRRFSVRRVRIDNFHAGNPDRSLTVGTKAAEINQNIRKVSAGWFIGLISAAITHTHVRFFLFFLRFSPRVTLLVLCLAWVGSAACCRFWQEASAKSNNRDGYPGYVPHRVASFHRRRDTCSIYSGASVVVVCGLPKVSLAGRGSTKFVVDARTSSGWRGRLNVGQCGREGVQRIDDKDGGTAYPRG